MVIGIVGIGNTISQYANPRNSSVIANFSIGHTACGGLIWKIDSNPPSFFVLSPFREHTVRERLSFLLVYG